MNDKRLKESNKITIKNITGNLILGGIKILSGIVGNSSAMITDGIHTLSDIITSISLIIGTTIASAPPDEEHKYGHGKAEQLTCFVLGLILLYVSIDIGLESFNLLFNLDKVKIPTTFPIIIAITSIILKEYQFHDTIKIANKIGSDALKADAWHHRSDSLSSIAVLIGIIGTILGYKFLEPIASIFVSICILLVSKDILKSSSSELLDMSLGCEFESTISNIVKETGLANNVSNIKSRKHGPTSYVDLDICVDENLTIRQGHNIAHEIESILIDKLTNIEAIHVHVEPCAGKNCTNKHHCKEHHI